MDEKIRKIAKHYGDTQYNKAVEELAELIAAVSRKVNAIETGNMDGIEKIDENLIEEMADVEIMLEQIRVLKDIEDYAEKEVVVSFAKNINMDNIENMKVAIFHFSKLMNVILRKVFVENMGLFTDRLSHAELAILGIKTTMKCEADVESVKEMKINRQLGRMGRE